ncbi:hypothetical protein BHE74_00051011, partial [Ensete ventricosum]
LPPPILLPPTAQELRDQIGGVSLQRSIVWIPLERRMLNLLHLLHPDLEYKDMRSPLNKVMVRKAPKRPRSGASLEAGRDTTLEEGRVQARSSKGKEPIRSKWIDSRLSSGRLSSAKRNSRRRPTTITSNYWKMCSMENELLKLTRDNKALCTELKLAGAKAISEESCGFQLGLESMTIGSP